MSMRLALLAALIAGPALAAGADAPVATAPANTPPSSTAEQIAAFLKTSPVREIRPTVAVDGVVSGTDRRPRGEINLGVGTGGYHSVYVRTELPVGDGGHIALAFQDARFGGGYERGVYGVPDRVRCERSTMNLGRLQASMGEPHGSCIGPPSDW